MADEDKKEEIKKDEEVKEETLREVVEEDVKAKEETPEEEPKEEVKEEPKEEEETKEEPAEVPLEEVAKEVETKTRDKVKEEILEALGVTEEQKKEAEEAGYKTPWEERGEKGPKSWEELLEASADLTDFRRKNEEKKVKEEEDTRKKQQEEYFQKQNEIWDLQLDELRAQGHLPKVKPEIASKMKKGETLTVDERRDEGLVAQYNLVKMMNDVSIQRQQEGKPAITNLKEIYYEYYSKDKKEKQPSGADAPISGGSTPIQPSEDVKYEDIHNKSFEEILEGS